MTAHASPGSLRDIPDTRKPPGGVASLLRRWLGGVAQEHRIHCGVREMMALDDRMLSDIGLARSEIRSAAVFGRTRNG